jgi:hypothetical protein
MIAVPSSWTSLPPLAKLAGNSHRDSRRFWIRWQWSALLARPSRSSTQTRRQCDPIIVVYPERASVQAETDFYKAIRIGKSTHKRYSGKCYEVLRAKLAEINLDELWANRKIAL